MSTVNIWYIRFPNGRIVRASSAEVVRRQLGAGRLPRGCTGRRSGERRWTSLEAIAEFADLAAALPNGTAPPSVSDPSDRRRSRRARRVDGPPATVSSRLDPSRLGTLGVGQHLQELISALDSTMVRRKLLVAFAAALCLGVLLGVPIMVPPPVDDPMIQRIYRSILGVGIWLIGSAAIGLLTQLTYVEVSRLRPAEWSEGLPGLRGVTRRVASALLLVVGGGFGLILAVRQLPGWAAEPIEGLDSSLGHLFTSWAVVAALVVEVAIWPALALAFLVPPVLVVENCGVFTGIRQWLRLIYADFGRVLLYQALAAGLGLIVALPLSVPLVLTSGLYAAPDLHLAAAFTRLVLVCLILAPVVAYWVVANVFIYLNLRYENNEPDA